ncbi:MAG: DNA polymerase III subunit gamma/tau, partial [Catalinimonas sp.]
SFVSMEQFVVSARKYRPSTFETVVGQGHVTTTLRNAILQQQLAQAFLFCGPRGVGKTTCARILAKTINCEDLQPNGEACDRCTSCVSFRQQSSFNVHELDAASNNSVDDIRNLVEQVRYAPQAGRFKVYIIDEVHMLSNAAFNAFLKTLEEPPPYAVFILATTEKHKIIPTILSRCQIFDFNRIQVRDIAGHLAHIARQEDIQAETEGLRLIAEKADGGLRDALSMFDLVSTFSPDRAITYRQVVDNLHVLDYDYYFQITEAALRGDVPTALLHYDEILRKGFDGHLFVVGLSEHFRDLLVCKEKETLQLLEVSDEVRDRYCTQAAGASASFLMSALHLTTQCDVQYKMSKNPRLLVELMLMKLCHVRSAVNLTRLASETPVEEDGGPGTEDRGPGITAADRRLPPTPDAQPKETTADRRPPPTVVNSPAEGSSRGTGLVPPVNTRPSAPSNVAEPAVRLEPSVPPQPPGNQPQPHTPAPPAPRLTPPAPGLKPQTSTPKLSDLKAELAALRDGAGHLNGEGNGQANGSGNGRANGGSNGHANGHSDAPASESGAAVEEKPPAAAARAPVSAEALETAWRAFVHQRRDQNSDYHMLSDRSLRTEGTTLHVSLDDKFQVQLIDKLRPELLGHLRAKLQNGTIELMTTIDAVTGPRRHYTGAERFRAWTEENPVLLEFKQRFKLDVEF